MKVLFLIKKRNFYSESHSYTDVPTSGLYNSANFVNNMLKHNGIASSIKEVNDANNIDREVHTIKPDVVFIEALWVTPDKFAELIRLHSHVKWIVRIHSNTPFLANEGIAMEWILNYLRLGITIAPNCKKMLNELHNIGKNNMVYLPNYYQFPKVEHKRPAHNRHTLNVACFGAIRPLKNQLLQALAAIKLANKLGVKLNFHINKSRIENNGNNVYKNIVSLFSNINDDYKLIQHKWLEHKDFLKLINTMDISMQMSFSETQNIVTCDAVSQLVPIVVSKEIDWVSGYSMASPTDIDDIVNKMERALIYKILTRLNRFNLTIWNIESETIWLNYIYSR